MTTILVTGVGGPLGQAVVKAAQKSKWRCRIVGTDRTPLSVGFAWADEAHILPDCQKKDEYLQEITRLCNAHSVDLILPASESEIRVLAENAERLAATTNAKPIVASPPILDVCFDKLETCRFLESHNLNRPQYAAIRDQQALQDLINTLGFPLLAKPCRGSGSQGIFRVRSEEDLAYIQTLERDYVIQELLMPDSEEYTVGVFTDCLGNQNHGICMRRDLAAGNTYRAWVTEHPAVLDQATRIVRSLGIVGPCNVQIRVTSRGAIPFEINPRFSGTTGMRAHFGYNEVEMTIRSYLLEEPLEPPQITYGTALRYWEETYLPTTESDLPVSPLP